MPRARRRPRSLAADALADAGLEQAEARCVIGRDYPAPIVDLVAAARHAREAVWAVRRGKDYAAVADAIQARHGSRRSGLPPTVQRRGSGRGLPNRQLDLDL